MSLRLAIGWGCAHVEYRIVAELIRVVAQVKSSPAKKYYTRCATLDSDPMMGECSVLYSCKLYAGANSIWL